MLFAILLPIEAYEVFSYSSRIWKETFSLTFHLAVVAALSLSSLSFCSRCRS